MRNTSKISIKTSLILSCIIILGILFLAACQPNAGTSSNGTNTDLDNTNTGTYKAPSYDLTSKVETKQFKDENELLSFIDDNAMSTSYYDGILYNKGGMMQERAATAIDVADLQAVPAAADGISSSPTDFSTTNIQVEGVDEADLLKTDGNYIYTISDNILYIVKAYPGEDAEVVSSVKFDSNPSSLFILGDKLAVFGNDYNYYDYIKDKKIGTVSGMSFFKIYDISDRTKPKLEKDYKFEGNYFRGRMKGDYVYFITTTYPQNRKINPMPIILEDNTLRTIPIDNIYYYDIDYDYPMFVNVNVIDMGDVSQKVNSASIVVEGSQEMYMSNDNIYVTYTKYLNEYDIQKQIVMDLFDANITDDERALIAKIQSTDNDILSKYEKEQKIWQVYERHMAMLSNDQQQQLQDDAEAILKKRLETLKTFEYTIINKISFDGPKVRPAENGKVYGHINNQFSMDERDNVLRIATTISPRWSRFEQTSTQSSNSVYTLDKDLKQLDEIEDLAKGEQIYSTRFIGDRLYMVTFRRVDPFFVIDLSDPEDIKELGKLKIPGFSRYLHPYDKNTIIGIGQDATESGRTTGLKISLFDVSDVEHPKEVAKYVTDEKYAQSSALWEHKAFLFSKEKNLLVIPVYSYNYQKSSDNYNGAFVFDITSDEIELRGLIDHSMASDSSYYWQPAVERSLYIENMLYTKSKKLLRINSLETLEKVKNVNLNEPSTDIKVY